MPTYEYTCATCEKVWDELHKIADRKEPEAHACPHCGQGPVRQGIFTPIPMGDAVRLGITKPNSGMKEVLQKVQERTKTRSGSVDLARSSALVSI
jgi:putative FmdB family regulatory protein